MVFRSWFTALVRFSNWQTEPRTTPYLVETVPDIHNDDATALVGNQPVLLDITSDIRNLAASTLARLLYGISDRAWNLAYNFKEYLHTAISI